MFQFPPPELLRPGRCLLGGIGIVNEKVAPPPLTLFCACILPEKDLEANLEKSVGNISGSIPVPVSIILTFTWLSLSSEIMCIFPFPPLLVDLVNLAALSKRLEITCVSLPLSASTKMTSSLGVNNNSVSDPILLCT